MLWSYSTAHQDIQDIKVFFVIERDPNKSIRPASRWVLFWSSGRPRPSSGISFLLVFATCFSNFSACAVFPWVMSQRTDSGTILLDKMIGPQCVQSPLQSLPPKTDIFESGFYNVNCPPNNDFRIKGRLQKTEVRKELILLVSTVPLKRAHRLVRMERSFSVQLVMSHDLFLRTSAVSLSYLYIAIVSHASWLIVFFHCLCVLL